jgi:hypothetical protein
MTTQAEILKAAESTQALRMSRVNPLSMVDVRSARMSETLILNDASSKVIDDRPINRTPVVSTPATTPLITNPNDWIEFKYYKNDAGYYTDVLPTNYFAPVALGNNPNENTLEVYNLKEAISVYKDPSSSGLYLCNPTFTGRIAHIMGTIGGYSNKDFKEYIIPRIPIYATGKKVLDRSTQEGFKQIFDQVKVYHPERSHDDNVIFSVIAFFYSKEAHGNPFTAVLRYGPTYSTFWEVIDRAKQENPTASVQGIIDIIFGWATQTAHEIWQHSTDIQHERNNALLFTASAIMIVMGGIAVGLYAAAPAATATAAAPAAASAAAPVAAAPVAAAPAAAVVAAPAAAVVAEPITVGGILAATGGAILTGVKSGLQNAVSDLITPQGESNGDGDEKNIIDDDDDDKSIKPIIQTGDNSILSAAILGVVGFFVFGPVGAAVGLGSILLLKKGN